MYAIVRFRKLGGLGLILSLKFHRRPCLGFCTGGGRHHEMSMVQEKESGGREKCHCSWTSSAAQKEARTLHRRAAVHSEDALRSDAAFLLSRSHASSRGYKCRASFALNDPLPARLGDNCCAQGRFIVFLGGQPLFALLLLLRGATKTRTAFICGWDSPEKP